MFLYDIFIVSVIHPKLLFKQLEQLFPNNPNKSNGFQLNGFFATQNYILKVKYCG